jgi:hypothetical protein
MRNLMKFFLHSRFPFFTQCICNLIFALSKKNLLLYGSWEMYFSEIAFQQRKPYLYNIQKQCLVFLIDRNFLFNLFLQYKYPKWKQMQNTQLSEIFNKKIL